MHLPNLNMQLGNFCLTFSLALALPSSDEISPSVELGRGEKCEWLAGTSGQDLQCLPGWVMKGVCGSGSRSDCSEKYRRGKYFYMIKCCQTKYQKNMQDNCHIEGLASGQFQQCSNSNSGDLQAMYGGCGSGRHSDCVVTDVDTGAVEATGFSTNQRCCDNEDITIQSKSCGWRFGNYGDLLVCPDDYLAAGQCGSGKSADCPSGGANVFIGLYCCPYDDNKR